MRELNPEIFAVGGCTMLFFHYIWTQYHLIFFVKFQFGDVLFIVGECDGRTVKMNKGGC